MLPIFFSFELEENIVLNEREHEALKQKKVLQQYSSSKSTFQVFLFACILDHRHFTCMYNCVLVFVFKR